MLKIKLITEDNNLLEFLSTIGKTSSEDKVFEFFDKEFLIENLADYIYLKIKKEIIAEITGSSTNEEFIKNFYSTYPLKKKKDFKASIAFILNNILQERDMVLEFEAVMVFRMRKLKDNFKNELIVHFDNYIKNSKYNHEISSLKEYISENKTTDLLIIRTYESKKVGLFNHNNELISLENDEEQENIVINSVLFAPHKIQVEDKFGVLNKETIVILTQLFEDKLEFI